VKLEVVKKKLEKISPAWVGEKHVPSLIRQLNKTFFKSKLYFQSSRYDGLYYKDHAVIVSGQYCPRMMGIPENMIITLSCPKESKKIKLSKKAGHFLELKILRAIYHEYRHKYQQKHRGWNYTKQYKVKAHQNKAKTIYYGNPDEIDAHAYETKVEWEQGKFDINKLRNAGRIGWRECEAIFMYRMHFRKSDPRVWRNFLKKVYKNNI
jgi:hypothetical protein